MSKLAIKSGVELAVIKENQILALQGSILKWEEIVAGTGQDNGNENCDLCSNYWGQVFNRCKGCPVYEYTGETLCDKSPYRNWADYVTKGNRKILAVFDDHSKKLAQAELDFLKGLLVKLENPND